MKKKKGIDFNAYNLKPAGAYRVEPSDFDILMSSIKQADEAAKGLLKETSKTAVDSKVPSEPKEPETTAPSQEKA